VETIVPAPDKNGQWRIVGVFYLQMQEPTATIALSELVLSLISGSSCHLVDYASENLTRILAEGAANVFFKPTNSIALLEIV
jgi:hypothetical protein